jgi:hypothetical protein
MNDDLGKILSVKSSEIKSYTANKQKNSILILKSISFLAQKGLWKFKNIFFYFLNEV